MFINVSYNLKSKLNLTDNKIVFFLLEISLSFSGQGIKFAKLNRIDIFEYLFQFRFLNCKNRF